MEILKTVFMICILDHIAEGANMPNGNKPPGQFHGPGKPVPHKPKNVTGKPWPGKPPFPSGQPWPSKPPKVSGKPWPGKPLNVSRKPWPGKPTNVSWKPWSRKPSGKPSKYPAVTTTPLDTDKTQGKDAGSSSQDQKNICAGAGKCSKSSETYIVVIVCGIIVLIVLAGVGVCLYRRIKPKLNIFSKLEEDVSVFAVNNAAYATSVSTKE